MHSVYKIVLTFTCSRPLYASAIALHYFLHCRDINHVRNHALNCHLVPTRHFFTIINDKQEAESSPH